MSESRRSAPRRCLCPSENGRRQRTALLRDGGTGIGGGRKRLPEATRDRPEPRYQRREIYAVWQRRSALRPARLSAGCWKSMTRAQGFLCRARKRFSRTFNVFPKLVRASPVPDSFSQSSAVLLNCSRGG